MAVSLGALYIDVLPNMAGFAAKLDAGVTEAAAGAEAGVAEATAVGVEEGGVAGAGALGKSGGGFLSKMKGVMGLAAGFLGYELVKHSIDAADAYNLSVKKLGAALKSSKLGSELPDLTKWTAQFSHNTGLAQTDLMKLEGQLATAGIKGTKHLENLTNAAEGLAQLTGKSVSMWTRSVLPGIINMPSGAISQLQKWKVLTTDQVNKLNALKDTTNTTAKDMAKNDHVSVKYAKSVLDMSTAARKAAMSHMEMAAAIKKGKDAYQSTGLDRLKNDFTNLEISIGRKLLPVIEKLATDFSKLIEWFQKGGPWARAIAAAVAVLTVAIIGYNAALKLTAAWEAIVEALNPFAYIAIAAVVATLLIVRYWKPISQFFEGIWKHIRGVVMGAFHAITLAVKVYVALFKFEWNVLKAVATSVWNAIHATVTGVFHSLMSAWNTVKNAFITGWNAVKTAGMAIWDAIVGAAKGALNGLISLWDSTIGRIAHGQHIGVGPLHVTLPNLYVPMMAEGGIVSAPTLAMIGEAGPEAVVPLNKLGSMGGGHTIAGSLTLTPDGRAFIRGVVVDENTQEAKHAASLQRQRRTR